MSRNCRTAILRRRQCNIRSFSKNPLEDYTQCATEDKAIGYWILSVLVNKQLDFILYRLFAQFHLHFYLKLSMFHINHAVHFFFGNIFEILKNIPCAKKWYSIYKYYDKNNNNQFDRNRPHGITAYETITNT